MIPIAAAWGKQQIMRGFRGTLRQLLRASLEARTFAGSSHGICQCSNAVGLRAVTGQRLSGAVWRELPGLQVWPFSYRGLRCSRLLHESVNVEVASFGESITGTLQLAFKDDVPILMFQSSPPLTVYGTEACEIDMQRAPLLAF